MLSLVANGNATAEQQLTDYAKQCVQLAYDYFHGELKSAVLMFKSARYFPCKIAELTPTCSDLVSLRAFPCPNEYSIIDGLKSELPQYIAEDVNPAIPKMVWWKNHEKICQIGLRPASYISLLFQPSSAVAESVFSLLKISCSTALH